jgi:hypothetical protein
MQERSLRMAKNGKPSAFWTFVALSGRSCSARETLFGMAQSVLQIRSQLRHLQKETWH